MPATIHRKMPKWAGIFYITIATVIYLIYRSMTLLPKSLHPITPKVISQDDWENIMGTESEMSTDDPRLIELIRSTYLRGPSSKPLWLKNFEIEDSSQQGQSKFVDNLLKSRHGGFFIECGASDGESLSNTLFFERFRNWTGLLVEPDPAFYDELIKRHRHAYVIKACLSPEKHSMRTVFTQNQFMGGLPGHFEQVHKNYVGPKAPQTIVECFPLESILLALNIRHVDYFSLDIEGPELEIIQTIPLHIIRIDVFTIEYRVWGNKLDEEATLAKLDRLREFFFSTGLYDEAGTIDELDVVFKRKDLIT